MPATNERRSRGNGGIAQAWAIGAAVAVPLLIFAIVIVALFGRDQQRAVEDLMREHARAAARAVDRYLSADLKALHVLAHATPAGAPEQFFLELRRVVMADPHWLMVRLVGIPESAPLAVARRRDGADIAPRPLSDAELEQTLRTGALIGDLETAGGETTGGETTGGDAKLHFVRLTVPVVRHGEPRAVLTAFINSTIFSQALQEAGIPASWTAEMLDRDHVIVGRSRRQEAFVGTQATESSRREVEAGADTFFFSENKEGDRVYTAAFRSGLSGWTATVGVPEAVVSAPLMRTMIAVGAGGLGAVALAVLAGGVLARNFASQAAAERQLAALAGERAMEQRVTDIAANLPGAIIRRVLHPDGTISYPYVSERITDVMGMPTDQARTAGSLLDWAPHVHPEDRAYWQRQVMTSARTMQGYRFDARAVGSDGVVRWVRSLGQPRRREDGAIVWDGVILDVTDLKKAEQRQQLLVQELSHRVKNTLAVVSSIARRTMTQTASVEEFIAAFDGRLQALGRAHTLLTRTRWEGSGMREVIEEALGPFRRGQGTTFDIEGPDRDVDPRTAITLTLVMHELATNALKYGALSVTSGKVSIAWKPAEDARLLDLTWTETGGPAVETPRRSGFGTTLITRSIGHELGGSAALSYPPTGVVCTIRIPLGEDPAA